MDPRAHGPGRCSAITLTAHDRVQQEEEMVAGQDHLLVPAAVQYSNNEKVLNIIIYGHFIDGNIHDVALTPPLNES